MATYGRQYSPRANASVRRRTKERTVTSAGHHDAGVQTAIVSEPGLRVPELKVRTFEGVVQLSGFVSSRDDIQSAAVNGVKAVADQTQLK